MVDREDGKIKLDDLEKRLEARGEQNLKN